jgi:hypothetical protein
MQLSHLIAGIRPPVRGFFLDSVLLEFLLLDSELLNSRRINSASFSRKLTQHITIKTEVYGKTQVTIC